LARQAETRVNHSVLFEPRGRLSEFGRICRAIKDFLEHSVASSAPCPNNGAETKILIAVPFYRWDFEPLFAELDEEVIRSDQVDSNFLREQKK